jgi:magnesium transporter
VAIEQITQDFIDDVRELLEKDKKGLIQNLLIDLHPADVAELIECLSSDERGKVFALVSEKMAGAVVVEVEKSKRQDLLEGLSADKIFGIVGQLESDDAADMIAELPPPMAEGVFHLMEESDAGELREILKYPEDSAGGIMAVEVMSVSEGLTAGQAIEEIRARSSEVGEFYQIFVVDGAGRLVGTIPLHALVLANPAEKVASLTESDVFSVLTGTDQEEVAAVVAKYDLVSVPVVDDFGRLVGRITVDDIVDVIEEEATEDIHRMAGTSEDEVEGESVLRISGLRLPWLVVGLAGGLLSAYVVSRYEVSFKELLVLSFFVPVIAAMAGNVAIQSSAIVIRAMATDELAVGRIWPRLVKEVGVGLINGAVCGLILFAVTSFWQSSSRLGLVVGVSLLAVILVAAALGALIPMLLRRLNVDPALATGPFVTTSNDVIGLVIYLQIATLFLGWMK